MNAKYPHLVMPENHMNNLYNSKNFFIRLAHNKRLAIIISQIQKYLENGPKKILDAGCGEGQLLAEIKNRYHGSNFNYYGLDVISVAVMQAVKRCSWANIKLGDILHMPFEDNYFDLVICSEVLEHIYQYEQALNEIERVIKPGGIFIVTFPNEILWTWSRFLLGRKPVKVPDHVNSFSPRNFKKQTKLKLISQTGVPFHLPFFISLGCSMVFKKEK